jgi:hypothetical protein
MDAKGGITELAAAILAGLVVIVVCDFIFLNANTGKYFLPNLGGASGGGAAPTTAPATTATGGIPPVASPPAVTC